jgi:hypothetical protein
LIFVDIGAWYATNVSHRSINCIGSKHAIGRFDALLSQQLYFARSHSRSGGQLNLDDDLPMKAVVAKKPRIDGQITALAGELFVAAELLKRGLQTSVTFGNAKAIDLFAHNPATGRNFNIQVKALRKTNYYPIKHSSVNSEFVYVFVLLNSPGKPVQYFVVPGFVLAGEPERFGKSFLDQKFPYIHPKSLSDFSEAWQLFAEP